VTLRARIAVTAALAVALAIVVSAFAVYSATGSALREDVDRSLREQARAPARELFSPRRRPDRKFGGRVPGRFGGAGAFVQLIDANGTALSLPNTEEALPVSAGAARVAREGGREDLSTVRVGDVEVRVLTVPVQAGLALQVARPLNEVDDTLDALRTRLALICLGGVALAGVLGLVVAARGVRPVQALAGSVDHVARTGDLAHRIPVSGDDEPARLARRFNEMLASLEQARQAQDQLVADASHELRTPLTALRANVELLASGAPLDDQERGRLLEDLTVQLDGVGGLVGDLVELARGDRPVTAPVPVDLEEVVHDAAARARAFWPSADIRVQGGTAGVMGDPDALSRAVGNLIDNAVKYGGGGPVEVALADGEVTVRDHGPGVPEADRERVFARFWRSPQARSRPGTGLGLAIVRQVAAGHGGTVSVEDAPGGGALFRLRIPPEAPAG